MLNISGLNEGVVLDHIEAGKSLDIYFHLGLDKLDIPVAIIKNAKSKKMGKKDIIKIEGDVLDLIDFDVIGYIDHNITINVIKNNAIVEKKTVSLPEKITNIIKCKNPRCITSIEQELPHIFYLSGQAILDCGDNTATEVDKEVMKILKKSYDEALSILRKNRDVMDKLAEFLIEKETITGKEFMKILREIKGLPEKVEIKKAILV